MTCKTTIVAFSLAQTDLVAFSLAQTDLVRMRVLTTAFRFRHRVAVGFVRVQNKDTKK